MRNIAFILFLGLVGSACADSRIIGGGDEVFAEADITTDGQSSSFASGTDAANSVTFTVDVVSAAATWDLDFHVETTFDGTNYFKVKTVNKTNASPLDFTVTANRFDDGIGQNCRLAWTTNTNTIRANVFGYTRE